MSLRRTIGYFTSPFFVPLRKLVVWADEKFGTCDAQLTLQPRACYFEPIVEHDGELVKASELQKKISKDKANIEGLGHK
jgi:hypothetical protein|tara:strand:+ start:1080 stop:1316 length:237 start_codon:yes stop_codon:yes gene_type:complete